VKSLYEIPLEKRKREEEREEDREEEIEIGIGIDSRSKKKEGEEMDKGDGEDREKEERKRRKDLCVSLEKTSLFYLETVYKIRDRLVDLGEKYIGKYLPYETNLYQERTKVESLEMLRETYRERLQYLLEQKKIRRMEKEGKEENEENQENQESQEQGKGKRTEIEIGTEESN